MLVTAHNIRFFRMAYRAMAGTLVLCASAWAAEVAVKNLILPEFDPNGRMFRRLKAETAFGSSIEKSRLENGRFEFFETSDSNGSLAGALSFKDAVYDRAQQIVESDGHVALTSAKGDVAGEGFVYEIGGSRLRLKSAVVINHNGVRVTGDSGEVLLAKGPSADEALIKQATLQGGIVMSGKLDAKLDVEKIEGERAVYLAKEETITLSSPIYIWSKGERKMAEGESMTIYVGKGRRPAGKAN